MEDNSSIGILLKVLVVIIVAIGLFIIDKPKKEEQLISNLDLEFEGFFDVKFYFNNKVDITITQFTWENILIIKKNFEKPKGSRGTINQNFYNNNINVIRTQIDLEQVYYIEYKRSIT